MQFEEETDLSFIEHLLIDWVRTPSVNPLFAGPLGGSEGELRFAEKVAKELADLGLETQLVPPTERPSVVGRLVGSGGGRSLMLNGHLDTVGVETYAGDPFSGRHSNGRIYGRGAYDMKAGLVACVAAVRRLIEQGPRLRGDVLVSAVADEEAESFGARAVAERFPVDGVVVTEPTELQPVLAHKGFVWLDIRTTGFACHGSLAERGVDANRLMAHVLTALDLLEHERARSSHPLLGQPSLHVGTINGGSGPSIYSGQCEMTVECRTLPGESAQALQHRLRSLIEQTAPGSAHSAIEVSVALERLPIESSPRSDLARPLLESLAGRGLSAEPKGVAYWADSGIFAEFAEDVVLFGPSGDGAHEDREWVDLESVQTVSAVLYEMIVDYCA